MFTPKTLSFLRSLKRNNTREWFHAHRDRFEAECRAPMIAVVERLALDLPAFAPELRVAPRSRCSGSFAIRGSAATRRP